MKVNVRIAPSPTGFLHLGTAQSALYNWLFARKNRGKFYLRIEDTDKERSTKEYERSILEAIEWLGLRWDSQDGGFYRQSERSIFYRKALEKLITEKKAFWCNHTKEDLEVERKKQETNKEPPRHICDQKNNSNNFTFFPASSTDGAGWILRLAVDTNSDRKVDFDDIIRGHIEFKAELLGDFSIAKSLDEALYNFAVVVDDANTEITHVIRGEDHISNTPKQILIYEALGLPVPQFAHLPLILSSDRSKLSKRHGATSVVDFKKDYLPDALINFLGSLSYTFSKELMTKEEMIQEFEIKKVHKSGAVFDIKKLNWLNSRYIKKMSPEEFRKISGLNVLESVISIITERLEKLSDVNNFEYFWKEPEYGKELLKWKDSSFEDVRNSLEESKKIIEFSENIRMDLDSLGEKLSNRGLAYWPLRVAVTGKEKSPDPVEIINAIGRKKTLERIKAAIKKLG